MVRAVLLSYSQILFSDRPVTGLFFLLASFATDPFIGACGLLATVCANLTGYWLWKERFRWELGLAGYNGLLIGLTMGLTLPRGWVPLLLSAALGALSAEVADWLQRQLNRFSLPVLGLPFLLIAWVAVSVAAAFTTVSSGSYVMFPIRLYGLLDTFLHDFGSVFFSSGVISGVLVLAGLIIASRVSAAVGLAAALAGTVLFQFRPDSVFLSLNLVIAPIGLAFFLAPSPVLPAQLLTGLAFTALVGLGLDPLFKALGVPMLILPLTITLFAFLLLGRRRWLGVELVPARLLRSPEQNLSVYVRRRKPRLRLPFFGTWFVSQGVHGGETHTGRLGHAWDFMVRDEVSRTFRAPGYSLFDYFCYGLLVTAPAPGRVVAVENSVPDNPPARLNEEQNWGNYVIIEHNRLEYSILCHLKHGSVVVSLGDDVRTGTVLGACGNSGYSGQPHLHYQLQDAPVPGADTLPADFLDYVVVKPGSETYVRRGTPAIGEVVRPLAAEAQVRQLVLDSLGLDQRFELPGGRVETWLGKRRGDRLTVRSGATRLVMAEEPLGLVVNSLSGPKSGLLHQAFDGLEFLPFSAGPGFGFTSGTWRHSMSLAPPPGTGGTALLLTSRHPGQERRVWFGGRKGIVRVELDGPVRMAATGRRTGDAE